MAVARRRRLLGWRGRRLHRRACGHRRATLGLAPSPRPALACAPRHASSRLTPKPSLLSEPSQRRATVAATPREVDMTRILLAVAALLALGGAAQGVAATHPGFTARVDNPWFPLKPGAVYTYRGTKDGQPSREVMTVTHRTATIGGYPAVVI